MGFPPKTTMKRANVLDLKLPNDS